MPDIYKDDNRKDRYNPKTGEYDRYEWEDNDRHENYERHSHEWVNTRNGEQGYHGNDCSKEDKYWGGKRWRGND